ncbi:MAG: hypothetical protein KDI13_11230 [Alphaproteobacteria bacterium]|nr:hypothetical protein [Alphaproteobacteria bacterium]
MYDPNHKNFNHLEFDDNARKLMSLIDTQNWADLITFYRQLHPSERHHAIDCCSYFIKTDKDVGCEDRPEPELKILLGGIYARRAFITRGFGRGDEVEEEQWLKAQNLSARAQEFLDAAIQKTPEDTAIYGFYILADLLSGFTEPEDGDPYKDHNKVDKCVQLIKASTQPPNIFAAQALNLYDSPKWFGSIDRLEETANDFINTAPNAAWMGIKAQALYEIWYWHVAFEEDKKVRQDFFNTLDSAPYKKELEDLQAIFLKDSQNPTIPEIEKIFAHNHFANLFSRLTFFKQARPHLQAMDKKAMYYPWSLGIPYGKTYSTINTHRLKSFMLPIRFS